MAYRGEIVSVELKLPKLPDPTPVKITISMAPDLHQRLQDYAALYADLSSSVPVKSRSLSWDGLLLFPWRTSSS